MPARRTLKRLLKKLKLIEINKINTVYCARRYRNKAIYLQKCMHKEIVHIPSLELENCSDCEMEEGDTDEYLAD